MKLERLFLADRHPLIAMLRFGWSSCWVLILVMFISQALKRVLLNSGIKLGPSFYNRYFTWSSSTSSGSNSGSGSQSSPSPPIPSVPSAPSSAANFDSFLSTYGLCAVAVSFQPKRRESKFGSAPLDSPSGEDNLFVLTLSSDAVAFGVADGVGGWSEKGYDSLAISRQLCASLRTQFEQNLSLPLRDMLHSAYQETIAKVEVGGTTVCFGVLSSDARKLDVLNLGDSWCGLFRGGKLYRETRVQTHAFNTPFQLSKIPQELVAKAAAQGKLYILDMPQDADTYSWKVQKGDVIMFATDGVTDNIGPQDTEIFLKDNAHSSLDQVALGFVSQVVKLSRDPQYNLVFSQELLKVSGQHYAGGKEDDVTVVLVEITR